MSRQGARRAGTEPPNPSWPGGRWRMPVTQNAPVVTSTYCAEPVLRTSARVSGTPHESESEEEHSCLQTGKLRLREIKRLAEVCSQIQSSQGVEPGSKSRFPWLLWARTPKRGCGPGGLSRWPAGGIKMYFSTICSSGLFQQCFLDTERRICPGALVAPSWGSPALTRRVFSGSEQPPCR